MTKLCEPPTTVISPIYYCEFRMLKKMCFERAVEYARRVPVDFQQVNFLKVLISQMKVFMKILDFQCFLNVLWSQIFLTSFYHKIAQEIPTWGNYNTSQVALYNTQHSLIWARHGPLKHPAFKNFPSFLVDQKKIEISIQKSIFCSKSPFFLTLKSV